MNLENFKVAYKKGTNKFNEVLDKAFRLSGNKTGLQKFKASIISILLGLLIAGIFILATGNNFLETYWLMIKGSFHHGNWKILMVVMGAFVLFGLSVAFSFRTGLFNIGGSGQMLLGGGVAIYIMFKLNSLSSGTIFLAFIIAILIGFIWAGLSGFLKAYFNVHEVVSTILLNWIAFYIIQQMYSVGSEFYSGVGGPSSIALSSIGTFPEFVVQYAWLISLISITLVIFIIWFVLSKTVFGYNLKVVGESIDVAKYAGINTKLKVIISLGVSGAIAGLGGGILYILKFQQVSAMSTLPTYGFDGIVIALLAFNSPLGILASGLFYGILNQGQFIIQFEQGLGNETYQIIIGIIIFFAAISSVFFKFNPIGYFRKQIALNKMIFYKESKENRKKLLDRQREIYMKSIEEYKVNINKNKEKIDSLKKAYAADQKDIRIEFSPRNSITELKKTYKERLNKAKSENNKDKIISLKNEYRKKSKKLKSGIKLSTTSILKYEEKMKNLKNNYNSSVANYGYFIKLDAQSLKKSEFKEIKATFKDERDTKYEEYLTLKNSIVINESLIRKRDSQIKSLDLFKDKLYLLNATPIEKRKKIASLREINIIEKTNKIKDNEMKLKLKYMKKLGLNQNKENDSEKLKLMKKFEKKSNIRIKHAEKNEIIKRKAVFDKLKLKEEIIAAKGLDSIGKSKPKEYLEKHSMRLKEKIKLLNNNLINKSEIKDRELLMNNVKINISKLSFKDYMKGNK